MQSVSVASQGGAIASPLRSRICVADNPPRFNEGGNPRMNICSWPVISLSSSNQKKEELVVMLLTPKLHG